MRREVLVVFLLFFSLVGAAFGQFPRGGCLKPAGGYGHYAGCEYQKILFYAYDPDGIDTSSISVAVGADTFYYPDHLTFYDDSLILFTPTDPFANRESVYVALLAADDIYGNHLVGAPRESWFRMDLDRPWTFGPVFPPNDTTITVTFPDSISAHILDTTSGIIDASVTFHISWLANPDGADYTVSSAGVHYYRWFDGLAVIDSTIVYFAPEDSISVCLHGVDNVPQDTFLCGPHFSDTLCWHFFIDALGPRYEVLYPPLNDTVACDSVVYKFWDGFGVDTTRIRMYVNGQFYADRSSHSEIVRLHPDTVLVVYYDPGSWSTGTRVAHRVISVRDSIGNVTGGGVSKYFWIDRSPPYGEAPSPADGAFTDSLVVSLDIQDSIVGVNISTVVVSVNGDSRSYPAGGAMSWDGTTLIYDLSAAGYSFGDGDSVEVCLEYAEDRLTASECGPNVMTEPFCWYFFVDQTGPIAEIISPSEGTFTACDDERIIIYLYDPSGVDTATVVLVVNGATYHISADTLEYINDTLYFTPPSPWETGTVNISITEAQDIFGHTLVDAPVTGSFNFDDEPPFVTSLLPADGEMVSDSTPVISVGLSDAGAGVDPTTARLNIGGVSYEYGVTPGFSWSGAALSFNTEEAGVVFRHGDTVLICLEVADAIDEEHCGPNVLDTCWTLFFDLASPIVEMTFPSEGVYTACLRQDMQFYIFDQSGIDPSTIWLEVDGLNYFYPSGMVYTNDTLYFTPGADLVGLSDTVWIRVMGVEDSVGNGIEEPYSWYIILDTQPPYVTGYSPADGERVSSGSPLISIGIADDGIGVLPSSILFSVEGMEYSLDSGGVSWDGSMIHLDCVAAGLEFSDGDTVDVCFLEASDSVSVRFCSPNVQTADSCWSFIVDLSGPTARLISPENLGFSACGYDTIIILLTDPNGVVPESICVAVNDTEYTLSDPQLAYSNDTLYFYPDAPFASGDTVTIEIISAYDILGHPMAGVASWYFIEDIAPPFIVRGFPPPDTVVSVYDPPIYIEVADSLSGVDSITIVASVNGDSYAWGTPGVGWSGDRFYLPPLSFTDGETVTVCLEELSDMVPIDFCGPNEIPSDSCWSFSVDLSGPVAELVLPDSGSISACTLQAVWIVITDPNGVVPESIRVRILGTSYTISSPRLEFSGDTVYFTPTVPWSDADSIPVFLTYAVDYVGNPLDTVYEWFFLTDFSPPVVVDFSPSEGSIISDGATPVVITVVDSVSGVDSASLEISVAGADFSVGSPGVSFDSGTGEITFDPTLAGFSYPENDTVWVCLDEASDNSSPPCGPNEIDSAICFFFITDFVGPSAHIIEPLDGQITACSDQQIYVYLHDAHGVDVSSIEVDLNGVSYFYPDGMSYSDTLLVFTPPDTFSDGDTVDFALVSAEDMVGNGITSSLSTRFYVDLSPPYVTAVYPPDGTVTNDVNPHVSIHIQDDLSGVDPTTISLDIFGVSVHYPTGGLFWDGDSLWFNLLSFVDTVCSGDTIEICLVDVADSPDLCEPNHLLFPYCFQIAFDFDGPIASIVYPASGSFSNCNDQGVGILIQEDSQLDTSSLDIAIDEAPYGWGSPSLAFHGDTLVFTPMGLWGDHDTIEISLNTLDDEVGNHLVRAPVEGVFYTDFTPPVITGLSPPDGSIATSSSPEISFDVTDDFAGVDITTLGVWVNGDYFPFGHPAVTFFDNHFVFHPSLAGLSFVEGDTVYVCTADSISDMATGCGRNAALQQCWSFTVDCTGPSVTLVSPPHGAVTSCCDQGIILFFEDANLVDSSTVELNVGGSTYGISSTEVHYSNDTLYFTPPSDYFHGETVRFHISHIEDTLGNVTSQSFWYEFTVDLEPPILFSYTPADWSIVSDPTGGISAVFYDTPAGLDSSSVVFTVNGVEYPAPSPAIEYGEPFRFHPDEIGLAFADGETVSVCVRISDDPDICPPNVMLDSCWRFILDLGGPDAYPVSPADWTVSSCDDLGVVFYLFDISGIDTSTVRVSVGSDTLDFSSGMLAYISPYLTYTPSAPFSSGDTVVVSLVSAEDMLGNSLESGEVVVHYIVDTEPPYVASRFPPPFGTTSDTVQPVTIEIRDELSPVDTSGIGVRLNGTLYYLGLTPGIVWDDGFLTIYPDSFGVAFSDGDTVEVCLYQVWDMPDTCGPNYLPSPDCWEFYVNLSGPRIAVISPRNNWHISCGEGEQEILVAITDDEGVDTSSIRMSVNGVEYRVGAGLTYTDTVLSFVPATAWGDGSTVDVVITDAADILGNHIGMPYSWRFIVDLSPPVVSDPYPSDGSTVGVPSPDISVAITDSLSAVDASRAVVEISGYGRFRLADGVEFSAGRLVFSTVSAGLSFADGETIDVCIDSVFDATVLCEPNIAPRYCFSFVVGLSGPRAYVISPLDGTTVGCEDGFQQILVHLSSPVGIDPDSILLTVSGIPYRIASPRLFFTDTLLVFEPSPYWIDGETVDVELLDASDMLGHHLASPISWSFVVDLSPPEISEPRPFLVCGESEPIISVRIEDLSPIDTSYLAFTVDGFPYTYGISPGVGYSDGVATLDIGATGSSFSDGDSVNVCLLSLPDIPDYCDGHASSPFCWYFVVDLAPPVISVLNISDGDFSSCEYQEIEFLVSDENGFDRALSEFVIDSAHIPASGDEWSYNPTTGILRYTPSVPFADGDTVRFWFSVVSDTLGNDTTDAGEGYFIVDLSAPFALNPDPPDGGEVSTLVPVISLDIVDSLSGVDPSSLVLEIDGVPVTISTPGVSWDGRRLSVDTDIAGFSFHNLDTVLVCLTEASDMALYCGANEMEDDFCFSFTINVSGPEVVSYAPTGYVSCPPDSQRIEFVITDDDGVDISTARLTVNGVLYTSDSSGVIWSAPELIFRPGIPWEDGDVVSVRLEGVADILGNPMGYAVVFGFQMDLSPPYIVYANPSAGVLVADRTPVIRLLLEDALAGVDMGSIRVSVNGVFYDTSSSYLEFVADTVVLSAPDTFSGGDTVHICVEALDLADFCEPNALDSCFDFYIAAGAPVVSAEIPAEGSFTSCADQVVSIRLTDPEGDDIDPASIFVSVDGTEYYEGISGFSFTPDDSLVRIAPAGLFSDGDIVYVRVDSVADVLGNALISPYSYSFTVDLSPPYITDVIPAPGYVADVSPLVCFVLSDDLSGVDMGASSVRLGTDIYDTSSAGVYIVSDTVFFCAESLGLEFSDGETLTVCLTAYDRALYCGANEMPESCFVFVISSGPPVVEMLSPMDSGFISCEPGEQGFVLLITDPQGVVPESIEVMVNGETFGVSAPEVTFSNDTLYFLSSSPWADGDRVDVSVVRAYDSTGVGLSVPYSFCFFVDLTPPYIVSSSISDFDTVDAVPDSLLFDIVDELAGVDSASISAHLDTFPSFGIDDGFIRFDGLTATVYLSSLPDSLIGIYHGGDTVAICLEVMDRTEMCEPNLLDTCIYFVISSGGPVAELVLPHDSGFVSCDTPYVVISLFDPDGVDASSILLDVDGTEYTVASSPDNLIFSGDTLYFFYPDSLPDGAHSLVSLIRADDSLSNPLTGAPRSWSFTVDKTAPDVSLVSPVDTAFTPAPDILLHIEDALSGIDTSSIVVIIGTHEYRFGERLVLEGGNFVIPSDSLDTLFLSGDTVSVCAHACDMAELCGANCTGICFEFVIGGTGPEIVSLYPEPWSFSSCSLGVVIFSITDPDGVLPESVRVEATFGFTQSFRNDSLFVTPVSAFDGDAVVSVIVVSACDSVGNCTEVPETLSYFVDVTPPVVSNISPMDTVRASESQFSFDVSDTLSGVDTDSVYIEIGSRRFGVADSGVSFDGERFVFDPSVLNAGMPWSPDVDSIGFWFHEDSTYCVNIHSADRARYCGENLVDTTVCLYVADDDIEPPVFSDFSPPFVLAGVDFYISCEITDTSGVLDDATLPYLVWDTDGDPTGGDTIPLTADLSGRFTTDIPLPALPEGTVVVYQVFACDNDTDFAEPSDRACGFSDVETVLVVNATGPSAALLLPADGSFSSCEYQEVSIILSDQDGVVPESSVVSIAGVVYTVDSSEVSISGDTLVFVPSEPFAASETVCVVLLDALDSLGNHSLPETLGIFFVDLVPPEITPSFHPADTLLPGGLFSRSFVLEDDFSGIDTASVLVVANTDTLPFDFGWVDFPTLGRITAHGQFRHGEEVVVTISVSDRTLYCEPNRATSVFRFVAEHLVPCDAYPIPFTPNGDVYNPVVWFSYPGMETEGAELYIYTVRGQEVFHKYIPPTVAEGENFWDGKTNKGTPAPIGAYTYIILRDGKLLCSGTVLLAR